MKQDGIWEIYQNAQELQEIWRHDKGRLMAIANYVPAGAQVLNIGVGRGTLEKILTAKGCDVHCLDPSTTSINALRETLALGDKAKVGYSQSIPFPDAKFDYVVMTEVLEHLADEILEATRSEVCRVLKPGGMFLGTVPAEESLIDGVVVCPDCGKRFHRWGHVQSFTRSRLEDFLQIAFKSVVVRRKVFADWGSLNWKGKLFLVLSKLQAGLDMKGSNQNFLFLARKPQ